MTAGFLIWKKVRSDINTIQTINTTCGTVPRSSTVRLNKFLFMQQSAFRIALSLTSYQVLFFGGKARARVTLTDFLFLLSAAGLSYHLDP